VPLVILKNRFGVRHGTRHAERDARTGIREGQNVVAKALTLNWKRMPAIIPAAMPAGMRRVILLKVLETPIRKMMIAAVM
jgi:hypothetical protein